VHPSIPAGGQFPLRPRPAHYGGIQLKSQFEENVARLCDVMEAEWSYEPVTYRLSDESSYWPDFWLPLAGLLIEVRGDPARTHDIKLFQQKIGLGDIDRLGRTRPYGQRPLLPGQAMDFLVIASQGCTFTEYQGTPFLGPRRSDALLIQCRGCERWSFAGRKGSLRCRQCGLDARSQRGKHIMRVEPREVERNVPSCVLDWEYDDWEEQLGLRLTLWPAIEAIQATPVWPIAHRLGLN